jgi:hypothetical protein
MTRDDDFFGHLEGYLDEYEGSTPLPEDVRNAIRAQLPSIKQRPAWWPGWRFPEMNQAMRIALASAAVVAVAVIGISLFRGMNVGGQDLIGGSPSPTPEPAVLSDGPLEAGTYATMPFPSPDDAIQFTFTVPDGWAAESPGAVFPAIGDGTSGPAGAAMVFVRVVGLYADPCQGNTGQPDIQVGPTVDDLVTALADHGAYESTAATDVVVDGYAGKQLELLIPSDIDFATCDDGQFWVWDAAPYAQGPGNRWQVTILDVDGTRVVILAEDFAATPASTQTELQAIVDSIQIDAP